MKKTSLYTNLVKGTVLGLALLLGSCSAFDDFLTVYPTDQITSEQFWEDKEELTSVLASCYTQFISSTVMNRILIWGECRSDNFVLYSTDDDLLNIMNANLLPANDWFDWAGFYTGIFYCNLVIAKGDEMLESGIDASFSESEWLPMKTECRALRALYYFYLIRAYRDVPLVTVANETSEGATDPVPQTSMQEILTFLIDDLEDCKDDAMIDYGNDTYNRGRITKEAVYTLLADLYLWRAAKNSSTDSVAKYPGEAEADYQRCIELCDVVLASKLEEFDEENEDHVGSTSSTSSYDEYPLYVCSSTGRVTDEAYNQVFGEKNSLESIFELQYMGTSGNYNSTISTYYGGVSSGTVSPGYFTGSQIVQSQSSSSDPTDALYSETDIRSVEAIMYRNSSSSTSSTAYQIIKYIATDITILDASDVWQGSSSSDNVSYENRSATYTDANWVVYRVSDVMLMKAEALACISADGSSDLETAFDYAKAIYDRSNPLMESDDYWKFTNYNTASAVLSLVMRERHREFFAEGKRWFDLVRMALRDGNTTSMLSELVSKYTSGASAIRAKLATLNSLFNPVYDEEMDVNTALVQNPAWDTEDTITRN